MNIQLKEGFRQVCVWPGSVVGEENIAEFETQLFEQLGTRVQYLEEVLTAPDYKNGFPVEDTGGRSDLFFAVHEEDIMKFAVPRLNYGIRWIEDVYGNGHGDLYPARIAEYKCWEEA